jgi:hypothetical protein
MRTLIYASLVVNVCVLIPVCLGLFSNADWTVPAYGSSTPARGILLAVYLAILIGSVGLLLKPIPSMVAALLLVQVTYKIITPMTVGTLSNPVVISNLAIAALHGVTLLAIWKTVVE